jgi:hypothetical protein
LIEAGYEMEELDSLIAANVVGVSP